MKRARSHGGLKIVIREFLRERGPMPKGELEERVREATRSYGDTTARRLREMVEDGEIAKSTDGLRVTWYSLLPTPVTSSAERLNAEPIEA